MVAAFGAALTTAPASIYEAADWWGGSVRGLRQLRKLVPARLAYFDRVIPDWSRRRVLDLGCGGGFMAEVLARRGAEVVGVDPCGVAIEAARAHAHASRLTIEYRVGRGEAVPVETGSVEIVVCVDVLEHVDDLDRVLREISRVLQPGGLFLFDTINRNAVAAFVMVTMAERVLRLLPRGTHDPAFFIQPHDLEAALVASGFEVAAPFVGLGPTGIDRKGDFRFGRLPTTALLYMGHARRR